MSWFGVVASIVSSLVLAVTGALCCETIAERYGLRRKPWMAFGFVVGVLGVTLMAIYVRVRYRGFRYARIA